MSSATAARIRALLPHNSARRVVRFQEVIRQRVTDTIIVLENITDPRNLSACLRTADALGIHYVATIDRYGGHCERVEAVDKGAGKWLSLRRFRSVEECAAWAQGEMGAQMMCTHLTPSARPLHQAIEKSLQAKEGTSPLAADSAPTSEGAPVSAPTRPRVALCFGNEHRGVSGFLASWCGEGNAFYIPQAGFVQSLNLSVAAALVASAFVRRTGDYEADLAINSNTKGIVSHDAASLAYEAALTASLASADEATKAGVANASGINAPGNRRLTADKPVLSIKPFVEQDPSTLQRMKPLPGERFVTERMPPAVMDGLLLDMLLTSVVNSDKILARHGLRPDDF